MERESVDALVTDPPYGLSEAPDMQAVLTAWLAGQPYTHAKKGFMGKAWDAFVPGPEYWREVYRVLKPGAHGLVFAGTRTWDIMGIALRLAGFEIRDCVQWLHGQGFPKSLDVSKAIDKAAGARREVIGSYKATGTARNSKHIGAKTHAAMGAYETDVDRIYQTAPATPDAKEWEGWGTALKPAWEPVILIRKPISEKTVAANVLKWGVGGLNIDGCRVEGAPRTTHKDGNKITNSQGMFTMGEGGFRPSTPTGRFPANLVLSCACDGPHEADCAAGMLDAQSGVSCHKRSGGLKGEVFGNGNTGFNPDGQGYWPADPGGGASRFFYCAKVSPSERNAGLEGLEARRWAQSGGAQSALKKGAIEYHTETQSGYDTVKESKNHHPTVKPLKLMRYLCRLVTPPGGTVIDPFAGSGSTGVAALQEGFRFIGIEREPEYVEIAEKRMEALAL